MHYANVFGTMPTNGGWIDSDGAVALAFGRNVIPDNQLHRVREILDKSCSGSHLAMLQYLANNQKFDHGRPNRQIASVVRDYILIRCQPVAVQWELAVTLLQSFGERWISNLLGEKKLFCLWPKSGQNSYCPKEVLEDARSVLPKMQQPTLLAHDLHLPRVYMLARKIWDRPIVGYKTITRSFDFQSVQKMTTTPTQWYWYESRARVHHLLHHWV